MAGVFTLSQKNDRINRSLVCNRLRRLYADRCVPGRRFPWKRRRLGLPTTYVVPLRYNAFHGDASESASIYGYPQDPCSSDLFKISNCEILNLKLQINSTNSKIPTNTELLFTDVCLIEFLGIVICD